MVQSPARRRRRIWRFASAEFDEAAWVLRVGGHPVLLETKPLEVLHELLLHAGEVVTKEELLDTVWQGVTVVEGSLPTAISKLRKVLDRGGTTVIVTVPKIGYRLACAVELVSAQSPVPARFSFTPGEKVPGRDTWQLERQLSASGAQDVWLARQPKTGECRVFKFADAPDRLRDLKREAALSRLLMNGLGHDAPIPHLLEWNFEQPPYHLEYAYGGRDLCSWAEDHGGLDAIAIERRVALVAAICRAVASVHAMGVLHKDLKPANILVGEGADWNIHLVDFGSGSVVDAASFSTFDVTEPDPVDPDAAGGSGSSTPAYRAPELGSGAVPTVQNDVYALGVILYQMVLGDFARTPEPGWESDVVDPLLCDDITLAAEGVPERRIASAALLAERLEQLEARRAKAICDAQEDARKERQRQEEERAASRRPFVRALVASMGIGLVVASGLAIYATYQQRQALESQRLAESSFRFIAEDVLASPDPAKSSADETVISAIKRASAEIGRRYGSSPSVAARLHLSIARALHQRADFESARQEYELASRLFAKADASATDDAITGRLNHIQMEAVSGQPERLQLAQNLLAAERARSGSQLDRPRLAFAVAMAEGAIGYSTDIALATSAFQTAWRLAKDPQAEVSPANRIKVTSSLALTLMRQGQSREAERLAREAVNQSTRLMGADHANTLVARQHLVTSWVMQGEAEKALEASAPLLKAMQARFGPDHRFTLALHSTRFEGFSMLGQYDRASLEAERVWRGAAASTGEGSHQAIVGQIDYATTLCRTPRRAAGLKASRDALEKVRASFGDDYPLTHAVRFYAAECLIANRRHEDAEDLLRELDRQSVASLTGQPSFAALVDFSLSEIAFARGDLERARTLLAKSKPAIGSQKDVDLNKRLGELEALLAS
jgi:DNA-binding winged helix-turn-helix (wHTH) protein